jgi:hypothetical protein
MPHASSTNMLLRRDARRAATPIDGPFAETKEWALSAAEPASLTATRRRPSHEDREVFLPSCRFAGTSIDKPVTEARREER